MLSRDSHNGNMFLSLLIGRWLVLLPPAVTLLHPQQNPARTAWVFAAALCSNVMLSLWHRAINRQLVCHPWLLGLDMLSAATYIAFTGGTQSPYYFYATTPLLAASFFFKVRGGVLAALVFTPLYLVATVFALRMSGGNFDDVEALSEVLSFYGIALVFGYSAVLLDRLRVASLELQDMQEELSRAETLAVLGRMVAHVSHEIRNPLVVLGGYAQHILRKADDPQIVRRNAQIISDNVRQLEDLLTDLLELTHHRPPQLVPGDVHEVLNQAWQLSGGATAQNPVTLHRHYGKDIPAIQLDRSSLLRAFLNVMRNAVQFMPQGGTLVVSTRLVGHEVQVEIADSGPGIAPELLPKIFDPFVTQREHGTGLGLAVTQEIVQQHGGRLKVKSEPGKGAAFVFHLPVSATLPAGEI
ncbi:MAG TPA: ATP-binding protein [Abditibacteriaceae bacterium]|jgi:signal transduction histidine kinase